MARKGRRKPAPVIGDPTDPRGMAAMRDRYLEHIAVRNYSPRTVEGRTVYLNYFIKWCEDRAIVRPGDVTKPIIDRYQRWLYHYRNEDGKPLTFSSQYTHLSPLKAWFKWLARENFILFNPASELDMPRLNRSLPKHILTASEVDQVINGADANTALIEEIAVTAANINDGRAGPDALPDNPGEVFADSAYRGSHFRDAVRAKGGIPRIVATGMWGRDEQATLQKLKDWNQPIHRVRDRIEKIFGTWKRSYGLRRMRWRGIAKAACQIHLTAIAYNLKRTLNIVQSAG